ncbi:histidine phosphatase family protein [Flexivirga sp. ID2601S]|uniref:Histidine phosphatase family protein n=1 Tax=Flexivirga aerilata TaxID=1656889 RepID=A0A849AGL6_9MICO|nr:histidine phosphatase family protein [Flexivirga aerilata]
MGVIYLVRHGQASFGADDYDVLADRGREQARIAGAALAARGIRPDRLVSGGLRRQRDTLAALADAAGWDLEPRVDARWDEFDHTAVLDDFLATTGRSGDFTDSKEFHRAYLEAVAAWTTGAAAAQETFAEFDARCTAALEAVAGDDTAVVVTSGGVIGLLAARLLGGDATRWAQLNTVVVNASISKVLSSGRGLTALTFNEHGHLEHDRSLVTYR